MTDDDCRDALRRWYERPFASKVHSCEDGPKFHDLVEWARSGRGLSPGELAHVQHCPRCRRTVAAIRRELVDLPTAALETEPAGKGGQPLLRWGTRTGRRFAYDRPTFRRMKRVAVRITGLAAAACLLIGLWLVWSHTGSGPAQAFDLREVGYYAPIPFAGTWLDLNDSGAVHQVERTIETARIEVEEALRGDPHESDPWWPWTQLYRHLKALGKWHEALAEMNAFLAYAEERDRMPGRYSMYYTCLSDLGDTYAALGNYDTALEYHKQSLAVAGDYQEWLNRTGRNTDPRPHALVRSLGVTLPPRLRALSTLSAARGDMPLAWDYHNQATDLLTDFFRQECWYRELPTRPNASLVELCLAVIDDGDKGTESMVIKVREHLLREAALCRLDRNLDAAEQALDLGATLPAYPFHDESRLDFNEPMERLRIAIARGDWVAALVAADEAERHTGPRHFEGRPTHQPIGVIARAELTFLRGVALASLDGNDPEALRLIESAIEIVNESAAPLREKQRERFLRRFVTWERAAAEIRQLRTAGSSP